MVLGNGGLKFGSGAVGVYPSSTQSIASGTTTTVNVDTEMDGFNPGNTLTVDLSNNLVTVEEPGLYLMACNIAYGSPGDGTRISALIDVDGSDLLSEDEVTGANKYVRPAPATLLQIQTTPVDVTLETRQDSGGSIDLKSGSANTSLRMVKVPL